MQWSQQENFTVVPQSILTVHRSKLVHRTVQYMHIFYNPNFSLSKILLFLNDILSSKYFFLLLIHVTVHVLHILVI